MMSGKWMSNTAVLEENQVKLPKFDQVLMRKKTVERPQWAHLGGGNLYRCFHAKIAQDLINSGELETGVVVFDTFGKELIEKGYHANDNQTLSVILKADGSVDKELIASTAEAHYFNASNHDSVVRMKEVFQNPSLQFVTVTITEKGYAVKDVQGNLTPEAESDIEVGPNFRQLKTTMGQLAYLMYCRYKSSAAPLALVSTDNFSHNGQRFKDSLLVIIQGWIDKWNLNVDFLWYLSDESRVAFPYSMIDRITPLPSSSIANQLTKDGISGMTVDNPSFAAFVNTEETHYLVIEDKFPNGRPKLEDAGVYLADRKTVNNADLMKVCSCLNPLHTSLAIFGCLLGFNKIYKEMQDEDLSELVKRVGYVEGLPVVVNPKIIDPKQFIDEVINLRLVNPNIPDAPQRIASDTSQKVSIRYGETIKAYMSSDNYETSELTFIPLTLAAWLRYLLAVDDDGNAKTLSPDPLLENLQAQLASVKLGQKVNAHEILQPILSNDRIFGVNLYEAGIGEKIENYFTELVAGSGQVREILHRELSK